MPYKGFSSLRQVHVRPILCLLLAVQQCLYGLSCTYF